MNDIQEITRTNLTAYRNDPFTKAIVDITVNVAAQVDDTVWNEYMHGDRLFLTERDRERVLIAQICITSPFLAALREVISTGQAGTAVAEARRFVGIL